MALGFVCFESSCQVRPLGLRSSRMQVRVDGVVKCWGEGSDGELGHGSTEMAGDDPGEMGINLPVTDLGEGARAVRIASSGYHTCAILQDASLKCWGYGGQGQPRPRGM